MSRCSPPPPGRADIQRPTSPSAQVASEPDQSSRNRSTGSQNRTIPGVKGWVPITKMIPSERHGWQADHACPPPLPVKARYASPYGRGAKQQTWVPGGSFFGLGATPKAECLPAPAPPGRRAGGRWAVAGWLALRARKKKKPGCKTQATAITCLFLL